MLNRLTARPAMEFGDGLARRFAELYPPALDKPGAPGLSANRLARIMEGLCIQAQAFRHEQRLGYYRRTRLAHAFKWRLMEYGYNQPLIDAATEALVVYMSKPAAELPALDKAREKRLRKAQQTLHRQGDGGAGDLPEQSG